jgi:hypothetical protein
MAALARSVSVARLAGRRLGAPAARFLAVERPVEDAEHLVFPREGPGLDYALNWSLNGDGVTPSARAFRLTKASAGAKLLGGAAPPAPAAGGKAAPEVGDAAFDAHFDAAAGALEAAGAIYVAEGDAPATRTPCRVITDDAEVGAAAIAHCLDRMPLRAPTELPVTAYVVPAGADFAGFVVDDDRARRRPLSFFSSSSSRGRAPIARSL